MRKAIVLAGAWLVLGTSAGCYFGPEPPAGGGSFVSRGAIAEIWSPKTVQAADLDGDGDLDVLTVAKEIAWHENVDGRGRFGEQRVIASRAPLSGSASAADLDGDGDLDVLAATRATPERGGISWYRNADGHGNLSAPELLAGEARRAEAVGAADLDGDGDADVLGAFWPELWGGEVSWFENRAAHER